MASAVLLRLGVFTGKDSYRRLAVSTIRLVADQIRRYPSGFGVALCAIDFYLSSPTEIALIGATHDDLRALAQVVWEVYLPNRVIVVNTSAQVIETHLIPLLRDREMMDRKPTAYVCENYTCKAPVTDPQGLASQLLRLHPRTQPAP